MHLQFEVEESQASISTSKIGISVNANIVEALRIIDRAELDARG